MPTIRSRLDIDDDRSPVQLVADNHHRWNADADGVRRIYLPARLKGRTRRLYLRFVLRIEAASLFEGEQNEARRNFTRAGGDCVCDQCGEEYRQHPRDIEPADPDGFASASLTILCDRSRVKL